MTLQEIRLLFNRSFSSSFDKKKLSVVFLILVLCGIITLFFRAIALSSGSWIRLSAFFLPIFLSLGVILSLGVFLIRIYHDERKHRNVRYRDTLAKSAEILIGASYFSIPFILGYLLLWMVLGIFLLLGEIPAFGAFFETILAFGPFLINLGSVLLCVLQILSLFFVTPIIAFKGLNRMQLSQLIYRRWNYDVFSNLLLAFLALVPFSFFFGLLVLSANLTGTVFVESKSLVQTVVQWFIVMLPFTAILSPTIIFFFNFAAESHVLMQRLITKNQSNHKAS